VSVKLCFIPRSWKTRRIPLRGGTASCHTADDELYADSVTNVNKFMLWIVTSLNVNRSICGENMDQRKVARFMTHSVHLMHYSVNSENPTLKMQWTAWLFREIWPIRPDCNLA